MVDEAKRGVGRPRNPVYVLRSSNPDIHLIDVKEAAWLLRWDVTTVRRKIVEGAIPATVNPRNPQTLEEANGLGKKRGSSKDRYRIKKSYIARRIYGTYIGTELQPMTPEQEAEAIAKLNLALQEYERIQDALQEKN